MLALPTFILFLYAEESAHGAKPQKLLGTIHELGFEFVQIDDVATGGITEALKGVDVVLSMASPLAGRKDLDETFQVCVPLTEAFSSSYSSPNFTSYF